jgi:hypothetical protein
MRKWLIRQDRPNGGILSFVGKPAFQAHWTLSADPPTEDLPEQSTNAADKTNYWFRTGDDEDDIVVQFSDLQWQGTPPAPERVQRLMASAVSQIDRQVGERF